MLIEFTIFGALFFVCVAIRFLGESIRDETKRSSVARRIEREAKRRELELKRAKLTLIPQHYSLTLFISA